MICPNANGFNHCFLCVKNLSYGTPKKNKTCLALFLAEYKKIYTTQLLEPCFVFLFNVVHKVNGLI